MIDCACETMGLKHGYLCGAKGCLRDKEHKQMNTSTQASMLARTLENQGKELLFLCSESIDALEELDDRLGKLESALRAVSAALNLPPLPAAPLWWEAHWKNNDPLYGKKT